MLFFLLFVEQAKSAWHDFYPNEPAENIKQYISNSTLVLEESIYIIFSQFFSIYNTQEYGAIFASSSDVKVFFEETVFFDLNFTRPKSNKYSIIHLLVDSVVFNKICVFSVNVSKIKNGFFTYVNIMNKSGINYLLTSSAINAYSSNTNYLLWHQTGIVSVKEINVSLSKCPVGSALLISTNNTDKNGEIRYSTFRKNECFTMYTCVRFDTDDNYILASCNFIENYQKTKNEGLVTSGIYQAKTSNKGILRVTNCSFLNNSTPTLFYAYGSCLINIDGSIIDIFTKNGSVNTNNMAKTTFINPINAINTAMCTGELDVFGNIRAYFPTPKIPQPTCKMNMNKCYKHVAL